MRAIFRWLSGCDASELRAQGSLAPVLGYLATVPYPFEYAVASQVFQDVLEAVRDETGLATKYQAYTVMQGVFRTFRRRLDIQDSLRFVDLLPVALRALYVHDWDVSEAPRPFGDQASMVQEVRKLRPKHNSAPDTCIEDVALAVRRYVDESKMDALLDEFPCGARAFWAGTRRPVQ
jgi:uncharacterized protein (DUF2267 family)